MKLIYYGFGAFSGFVCGTVINLIFYWLEQSGVHVFSDLVKNYGIVGRYLVELIHYLPVFGIALGVVMVKLLFGEELDKKKD